MPLWPFSASRMKSDADLILAEVTKASRNPALFGEGRVADTLEGRFEVVTLYAALVLIRLQNEGEAAPLAQAFVDNLFRQFDAGLREDGVGDLVVGKRVNKLAGVFYGRVGAYSAAIAAQDNKALAGVLVANVTGRTGEFAEALARHMTDLAGQQAARPWQSLLRDEAWPPLVA